MKGYPLTDYSHNLIYVPKWVDTSYYDLLYFEHDNPNSYYLCRKNTMSNIYCDENIFHACFRFDSSNHYIYERLILCQDYVDTKLTKSHMKYTTHDIFYRNDISDILIVVAILSIVLLFIPYKIISKIFGKWLKI